MRQTALYHPAQHDQSDATDDVPRESGVRLTVAPCAHTRPTTPVPSFHHLSLSHDADDDSHAHDLAGRLFGLAEETWDAIDAPVAHDAYAHHFEEVTRTRAILPARPASTAPAPVSERGPGLDLDALTRVPHLRITPRDIPLQSLERGQTLVLALIDGRASIEQILDTSPMPVAAVLRILNGLLASKIIALGA